jgi:hypothetical protein
MGREGERETVYEVVWARERTERGLWVVRQVPVPITYKGIPFDEGFRAVSSRYVPKFEGLVH